MSKNKDKYNLHDNVENNLSSKNSDFYDKNKYISFIDTKLNIVELK